MKTDWKKKLMSNTSRTGGILVVSAAMLMAVILVVMSLNIQRSVAIDNLENNRSFCETAIDELSRASDYMTSQSQQYSVDGDWSHMTGYWTEVDTTQGRDQAVQKLMHSGLTDQEMVHVLRAKAYSDELMTTEIWAMRMVAESQGVPEDQLPARVRAYTLNAQDEALSAADKKAKAQSILFGPTYGTGKRNIYSMVATFKSDLAARMKSEAGSALASAKVGNAVAQAAVALMMVLIVALIYLYARAMEDKNQRLSEALTAAEAASSAKSFFTSRMSHEIRTPLNGVMGYLSLAQTAKDEAQRNECLAKSQVAAGNLLGIINDVLDLSAIENRKMKLACEPFSIGRMVEDVGVIYENAAREKGVALTVAGGGLPADWVAGDRMRTVQILSNLLSNAVKFTPEGGTILLQAAQAPAEDGTAATTFTVADDGIGMNPDFLPRVFDAYEQQDAGIAQKYGGTGLGLSIVKSLAEMMGGGVSVESLPGVGSTFTVVLHYKPAPAPAAKAQDGEDAPADITGMAVLVAEDNPMNSEIARRVLEHSGVRVTCAANGREAVDRYLEAPAGAFEAVLMDIMMPELDGFGATRAIRDSGRPDARSLPILAMSANAFDSDVKAALESGMDGHIAKPFQVSELIAALARVRRRHGGEEV